MYDSNQELVKYAIEARKNSYSPYSQYKVGAAVRTKNGKIYQGTNIENAAYGSTICAERAAIFSAVSNGDQEIEEIAVVTKDGGSPCGSCRQVINEFNPNANIILATEKGEIKNIYKLSDMLLDAFGPKNLTKKETALSI